MTVNSDDFHEYKRLFLDQLARLEQGQERIALSVAGLHTDVELLKFRIGLKAGVYGGGAGGIASALAALAWYFLKGHPQ